MSLQVPEGPIYTAYVKRAFPTLNWSNQRNTLVHGLTQPLQRTLFVVTTIRSYLDFCVPSNILQNSMLIQLSIYVFLRIVYLYLICLCLDSK